MKNTENVTSTYGIPLRESRYEHIEGNLTARYVTSVWVAVVTQEIKSQCISLHVPFRPLSVYSFGLQNKIRFTASFKNVHAVCYILLPPPLPFLSIDRAAAGAGLAWPLLGIGVL
jgi:hypothetical protein